MTPVEHSGESEAHRPRLFLHAAEDYLSIGFSDTNDTLLVMPAGSRDRDRVREWASAVERAIERAYGAQLRR